jgi:hypothetical protein
MKKIDDYKNKFFINNDFSFILGKILSSIKESPFTSEDSSFGFFRDIFKDTEDVSYIIDNAAISVIKSWNNVIFLKFKDYTAFRIRKEALEIAFFSVKILNAWLNEFYEPLYKLEEELNKSSMLIVKKDYEYLKNLNKEIHQKIWKNLYNVWKIFLKFYTEDKKQIWFKYSYIPHTENKEKRVVILFFGKKLLQKAVIGEKTFTVEFTHDTLGFAKEYFLDETSNITKEFLHYYKPYQIRLLLYYVLYYGGDIKSSNMEEIQDNDENIKKDLNLAFTQTFEKNDRKNRGVFIKNIIGPRSCIMGKFMEKDIWLFGENHLNFEIPKNVFNDYLDINPENLAINEAEDKNTITFERFLFALITENLANKRYCDIFIELSFDDEIMRKNNNTKLMIYSNTIDNLRTMLNTMNCYELSKNLKQICLGYPYTRIHFIDYRSYDSGDFSLIGIFEILEQQNQDLLYDILLNDLPTDWIKEYQQIVFTSKNFAEDILKFVTNMIGRDNKLDDMLYKVRLLYPSGPCRIGKQYMKLFLENKDLAKTIATFINHYSVYDAKKKLFYDQSAIRIKIDKITWVYIRSWEMDAPTLCRMFRKFGNDSNLKIFYGGDAHANFYQNFLHWKKSVVHSNLKGNNELNYKQKYIELDDESAISLNNLLKSPSEDINCSICSQFNVIATCSHCGEYLCSKNCFKKHINKKH